MSKENTSKKLVRSKSGFRIIAVNDNFKSPFLLPEPKWIPDKEVGPRLSYTISKLLYNLIDYTICYRCSRLLPRQFCDMKD